jgi:hypothetical protein
LLPLEDELERMKSPALSTMMARDGSGAGQTTTTTTNSNSSNNGNTQVVVPGNSYDDYFHEARERFQYGVLARSFWQTPYPPIKNRQDVERETEDRKGRPKRPKSMVVGREAARMMNNLSASHLSNSSNSSSGDDLIKRCSNYEGLFLHRLFDLFAKMLESTMEQNLLVTSILQKIAGMVDRRVDGVICDWRAIRVGEDGSLYGGVWTLPTTTTRTRRSLYALLEQVTFEALKRAQLVPNFETRISLAKKRGVSSMGENSNNMYYQQQQHHHHQQQQQQQHGAPRSTALHLSPSQSTPRESTHFSSKGGSLSKQPSFSHLVFQHNNKHTAPLPSPPSPTPSKSAITPHSSNAPPSTESSSTSASSSSDDPLTTAAAGTIASSKVDPISRTTSTPPLPARLDLSTTTLQQNISSHHDPTASPSHLFFQQKANATPVTMTNPFAKLSNFVHAYIVLQEFCKEIAAVILVRHATDYPDEAMPHVQQQQQQQMGGSSLSSAAAMMNRQKMMAAWHQDQYYVPPHLNPTLYSPLMSPQDDRKWKQRMSVATLSTSTYDWRNGGLEAIDEATKRSQPL